MAATVTGADSVQDAGSTDTLVVSATASGSNRALTIEWTLRATAAVAVSSVARTGDTFAIQGSQVEAPSTAVKLEMWGSTDEPGTSASDLTVTMDSAKDDWGFGWIAFDGVDQAARFDTPVTSTANTGTSTATSAITSATGNFVVDVVVTRGDNGTHVVGALQTVQWSEDGGTGGADFKGGGSTEPGGSSITMSWTWPTSGNYCHLAMDVKAAANGGGGGATQYIVLSGEI